MNGIDAAYSDLDARLTAPGEPFETVDVRVDGRPLRTWRRAPTVLPELFGRSLGRGDAEHIVAGDERWTFGQHRAAVLNLAARMRDEFGIGRGDRVAIAMRNHPEWTVAFWASAMVGAIVVPLNSWWTGPELRFGLDDSGASLFVCDAERLALLGDDPLPSPALVVCTDLPLRPGAQPLALDLSPIDFAPPPIDPDDDATLMYTSGTTGRPKGVIGTHRNICSSVTSIDFVGARDRLRFGGPPPDPDTPPPTLLVAVPFFHATGLHGFVVGSMARGNRIVLMHKWDAAEALRLVEQESVNVFSAVPAMVREMADHPDSEFRDTSSLVSITSGGAAAAPELIGRVGRRLPASTMRNGYGLTETSTVVTMINGSDYAANPGSVGIPIPICDLRVVGDDGADVSPGAVGELWIRGPNVARGYWNRPEETADTFSDDGWFRSGDLARIDDGLVYIVDRLKDVIIRGGENISSVEVEAALFEHPDVADTAVIPVPHEVLGEEPGAVVQRRPGADVTERELRGHVAERLAAFKVPVRIWIVDDALPRSPQGKVLKRELRSRHVG